jgi:hypothetical protein
MSDFKIISFKEAEGIDKKFRDQYNKDSYFKANIKDKEI